MNITLYKNCILNTMYTEVFRTKGIQDAYLNDLTKLSIENIDDVYYRLNDSICLNFNVSPLDAFDYNYMKIESGDDVFYAFISSIDVLNECVNINFNCDYWATFNGKWYLRESMMTNSRYVPYGVNYELPLQYISNAPLKLNYNQNENNEKKFNIIIELQTFTLDSAGNTSERENFVFKVGKKYTQQKYNFNILIGDVENLINYFTKNQNKPYLYRYTDPVGQNYERKYYDIVNVYVLPEEIGVDIRYNYGNGINWFFIEGGFSSLDEALYTFTPITMGAILDNDYNTFNTLQEYTIPANHLIKSYGFFTSQIPYLYNGKDKYIKISYTATQHDFKLFMNCEQGNIEITQLFDYELNFSVVSPEVLVQQKIQKKMQTAQGIMNIVTGGFQTILGATGIAGGMPTNLGGNIAFEQAMAKEVGGIWSTLPAYSQGSTSSIMQGVGNGLGGIGKIVNGIQQLSFANASKYKNSSMVNNSQSAFFNALFGFCYFELDSEFLENEREVENAIKECGYNIEYFTNDLDLGRYITDYFEDLKYNIVKFSFIRVVGLTSNINAIIENILTNGVKIWYTSVVNV